MAGPVIVVGSGPAGVAAAWPLVQAGLDVRMLDASSDATLPPSPTGTIGDFRRDGSRWRAQFGADLAGLQHEGANSPKLATPMARGVLEGFAPALGLSANGFLALGSLGQGGLSKVWGGVAAIYDAHDLAAFPFGTEALQPSYDAVMARIGVSGAPGHPEGPALTPPASRVFDAHARRGPAQGFRLRRTANALLMHDMGTRQGCARCGLCLWGCARGSVYDSATALGPLRQFPNFTYHPGHRVEALDADGPAVIAATPAGPVRIAAARVVLAAGTLATTALVVRRLGLLDTPVTLLNNPAGAIAFLVPSLVGAALPGRSFALAQLSYEAALPDGHGDGDGEAAGCIYGADTLPLTEVAARMPFSRPVALRLSRALAPALLLATIYLPGRFSRNVMRVHQAGLSIEGATQHAASQVMSKVAANLARRMRSLGAYAVPGSFSPAMPGADAHYGGTLPMGRTEALACSPEGEVNGLPGFFVVDGAALPALPAKHCTLTIMANADRIGRLLAQPQVRRMAAGA